MVAQFLGENEEEVAKRKKGAQGIPTSNMGEHSRLMKFVAQAVCLKKDDKIRVRIGIHRGGQSVPGRQLTGPDFWRRP